MGEGRCHGQGEGAPCSLGEISASMFPNPSFEEITTCPTKDSQLDLVKDWTNPMPGSTPDLWVTSCPAPSNLRLKVTYPAAADGEAMIGLARYKQGESFFEYAGTCLKSPIVKGRSYTFSFFCDLRSNDRSWWCDMGRRDRW